MSTGSLDFSLKQAVPGTFPNLRAEITRCPSRERLEFCTAREGVDLGIWLKEPVQFPVEGKPVRNFRAHISSVFAMTSVKGNALFFSGTAVIGTETDSFFALCCVETRNGPVTFSKQKVNDASQKEERRCAVLPIKKERCFKFAA